MLVNITENQFKILISIGTLTEQRKDNKNVYVNTNSISKDTNLTWKTVDKNLIQLKNIQGL